MSRKTLNAPRGIQLSQYIFVGGVSNPDFLPESRNSPKTQKTRKSLTLNPIPKNNPYPK